MPFTYITNIGVLLCLFTMSTRSHLDSLQDFLEDSSSESSSHSQTNPNASLLGALDAFIGSSPSIAGKSLENDDSSTDSSSHSLSDTNLKALNAFLGSSSSSLSSKAGTFSEDESRHSEYFESPHPTAGVHSDISEIFPSERRLPSTYDVLESSSEKHKHHHLSMA